MLSDSSRSSQSADSWTLRRQVSPNCVKSPRSSNLPIRGKQRKSLDLGSGSGTDSFAAAMQEVAASSEEQSASSEQIAAAAATLAAAAAHVSGLVGGFKLEGGTGEMPIPTAPSSGDAPNAYPVAPSFQPA